MGIFCLANRGATIESCYRRVDLTPAHFCGKEEFVVDKSDRAVGTKFTFGLSVEEAMEVRRIVGNCARYYPLPVYLAGEKVKQSDFLETALFRRVWQGLEIGVVKGRYEYLINRPLA